MVVFGSLKSEETGKVLYQGTFEECEKYIKTMDMREYYNVDICEDDGRIKKYVLLREELVNEEVR